MSKERRTVTLDPDADDYLNQNGVNASELVNELVKNHMSAGGNRRMMLKLRAEQIRSEISELEGRVETKQAELESIQAELDELSDERSDVFDQAAAALSRQDLKDETSKVEWWADEAGVSTERLKQEVQDRIQ